MSNIIQSACWLLEGMTPGQKLVLISLADQANDDGYCWPSVRTLERRTGMSRRGVQTALSWLEQHGVIARQHRTNLKSPTSSIYKIRPAAYKPSAKNAPSAETAPPRAEIAPPPAQSVRGGSADSAPPLAQSVRGGGAPIAPKPSYESPYESQVNPQLDSAQAADAAEAVDWSEVPTWDELEFDNEQPAPTPASAPATPAPRRRVAVAPPDAPKQTILSEKVKKPGTFVDADGVVHTLPDGMYYPGPHTASYATWQAYAQAYYQVYGDFPIYNRQVAGRITDLIARLGASIAPAVASFYVLHVQEERVVRSMHSLALLQSDAQKWVTQYRTGQRMTAAKARRADGQAQMQDTADEAMNLLMGGRNAAH